MDKLPREIEAIILEYIGFKSYARTDKTAHLINNLIQEYTPKSNADYSFAFIDDNNYFFEAYFYRLVEKYEDPRCLVMLNHDVDYSKVSNKFYKWMHDKHLRYIRVYEDYNRLP